MKKKFDEFWKLYMQSIKDVKHADDRLWVMIISYIMVFISIIVVLGITFKFIKTIVKLIVYAITGNIEPDLEV